MTASPNASAPRPGASGARMLGGVVAQLAILAVIYMLGVELGPFLAPITWFAAMFLTAAGIVVVSLLGARHRHVVVIVPLVSIVSVVILAAASHTTAVACNGQAVDAFEELTAPPGAAVDLFVSSAHGCMAELTMPPAGPVAEVMEHYRNELTRQGWNITLDDVEGLRAEQGDVYVIVYRAEELEDVTYFILGGNCEDWATKCGDPLQ